jgi:chromosomal replication initiator protein
MFEDRRLTVRAVIAGVAAHYGLSFADMAGPLRARRFSRPRHIAMYLAREKTGKSLPLIGQRINRHHTSVLHGLRAVRRRLDEDARYAARALDVK